MEDKVEVKIGDVVYLKSDEQSPMTVDGGDGNTRVICVWFNGKELRSGSFNKESLTPRVKKGNGVNF